VSRVLLVTQPTDGGVFQHVTALGTGVAERGHEVLVAGPLESEIGIPSERLELVRAISPRADAGAVARLARLLRRWRPDVVHAHSSKAGAVARMARAARPGTPLLYTPHGYAFNGWFESERERSRYRTAERMLAPLTTMVLCVCEAERRLAESLGSRRTEVVYNGVPEAEPVSPHPALAELRARGPVVGVLSLLRPGKGLETLIDAAPALLAEHPDASIAIAGEGPDRAALERRARELGVGAAVVFLGLVGGPGPLLAGIDVFANPSWAESFPLSTLEAMQAALPVAITDVGGAAEAIVAGESGVLVPPRDPAALAGALAGLLADHERARTMGAAARLRVQERFGVERMIDEILGVYARSSD
jgi:glycosyltransferase involved in cell wall biosynthesis